MQEIETARSRIENETTGETARPARGAYATSGREPPLEDLLQDPTTRAVMASDRVRFGDLRDLVMAARLGLRSRPPFWRG